jgi:DNA ligase 1
MAWNIHHRNGLWLPQIEWWLDAQRPAERSFVSHAHFDHIARHREILCSVGTSRLMNARLPSKKRTAHLLAFGQTEQLTADTTVTLYPAGHVLGSAQILLEQADHGRLLYTGDFKLRPSLAAEPCATPQADVLIMETTYGRPRYVMPPTGTVVADIVRFCRETLADDANPVLYAYSLGKSQELLACVGGAGLPMMLHKNTASLTRIYEECGLRLPAYREFDAASAGGQVIIAPPQAPGSPLLKSLRQPRTAMISGWALDTGATYRYRCDAAFALTDHADYTDLLRFVELVRPQKVLTVHGFAEDFARTLRERGIESWALGRDNQLDLRLG